MLHGFGIQGFEVHGDAKILLEHFHCVDAADSSRHGKAHGIAQALLRRDDAMANELATAAETFHSQRGDAPALRLWQHVSFEAAEGSITAVERHLYAVERKIVRQHF